MAYRTATEPARLFGPAEFLARPELDRSPRRDHHAPTFAPLAVVWLCIAFLAGLSGAFKAGREVEKGSQFGRILALSQELEVLEAAVARSDSGMRMVERLTRGARMPQRVPRMLLETTINLPAPTVPPIPLPQIHP